MKRFVYLLLAALCVTAVSCQKRELAATGIDLGKKVVSERGGSFPVLVTSEGAWQACSESDWISVDGSLHSGESTFNVSYQNNFSYEGACRLSRIGRVKIVTCDGATEAVLHLWQKGKTPVFTFPDDNEVSPDGGKCSVACATDLPADGRSGISLHSDASWIGNLCWGADGKSVTFDVSAGSGRSAEISLTHTDSWGVRTSTTFKISQK